MNSGAHFNGRYKIDDTIYRSVDPSVTLINEFLRLRFIPENIWDDKQVILTLRRTQLKRVGKNSEIPLKLQLDKKSEALNYIQNNLDDKYAFDFSFSRVGWQYLMKNSDVVDLEIIEDLYPSIEFKSTTDDGLRDLLARFDISETDVIVGPSGVAVKDKLDPNSK